VTYCAQSSKLTCIPIPNDGRRISRTPIDRVFAVGANAAVVANHSVPLTDDESTLIMPNYDQMLPEDGPRDTMVSSLRLKFSTRNELVRKISSFSFGCFQY
jgi:hypothetical protein